MWAVMASGQSLTDDDVDYVRLAREDGKLEGVVAISNVGIDKAPWADYLVSSDSAWWTAYPQAFFFKGRKFSKRGICNKVESFDLQTSGGLNSGLMGMMVARDIGKATKIIILGIDMHGTHYFGPHTAKSNNIALKNTDKDRLQIHIKQFERFRGAEVINCSMDSALNFFPKANLRDIL